MKLKDKGNIILIVEYNLVMFMLVDYVVEMGFVVGCIGGNVIFIGIYDELLVFDMLMGWWL